MRQSIQLVFTDEQPPFVATLKVDLQKYCFVLGQGPRGKLQKDLHGDLWIPLCQFHLCVNKKLRECARECALTL